MAVLGAEQGVKYRRLTRLADDQPLDKAATRRGPEPALVVKELACPSRAPIQALCNLGPYFVRLDCSAQALLCPSNL